MCQKKIPGGNSLIMGDDVEDRKVYVGSLSFNTTDDTLRACFETIGEVEDGKNDFHFLRLQKSLYSSIQAY